MSHISQSLLIVLTGILKIAIVWMILNSLISNVYGMSFTPQEEAFLKTNPVVKIGLTDEFLFASKKNNKIRGYLINIIDVISHKTGIRFEAEVRPWAENFQLFQTQKIDMIANLLFKEERQKYTLYSTPYTRLPIMIFSRKEAQFTELNGLKVGVTYDTPYLNKLKEKNFDLVFYASQRQQMLDLSYGKIDVAIQTLQTATHYIRKKHLNNIAVVRQFEKIHENLHFGIRKELPLLHSIVNKVLDNISPSMWVKINKGEKFIDQIPLTFAEKQFIRTHPQLILGAEKSWAPYIIKNKDGSLSGFEAEIVDRINSLTGANFSIQTGRWDTLRHQVKSRGIDGIITSDSSPIAYAGINFSSPIIRLKRNLLVKRTNPLEIHTVKDLKGKVIAVHQNNPVLVKLAEKLPQIKLVFANSIEETLKLVILGQADATFGDASYEYQANQLSLPYLDLAFIDEHDFEIKFGMRKDWPEAISIINKALAAISQEDLLQLKRKWFMLPAKYVPNNSKTHREIFLTAQQNEYLRQKGTIKFCIDRDRLPYESFIHGHYEGIVAELHRLISHRLNLNSQFVITDNQSQLLDFSKNRKCDVVPGLSKTTSRSVFMDFTRPVFTFPLVLVAPKDQTYIGDIKTILDKKFAITRGHAAIEILKQSYPDIKIVGVDNIKEGIRLTKAGKVFGYIDTGAGISNYMINHSENEVKIVAQLSQQYELAIASRNDEALLGSIFSLAVEKITLKEKKQILEDWVFNNRDEPYDSSFILKIVSILSIILLLILIQYKVKEVKKNNEHKSLLAHYSKTSSVGEMVFNIAHQWRQPLTELSSKQMILETKLKLNKNIAVNELAAHITDNNMILEHMSQTIDTFMNFYKSNNSLRQNFSLKEEIEKTLVIFDGMFLKEKINVHNDLQEISIYGNPGDFTQILVVLLSNAKNAAYHQLGERHLWIKLSKQAIIETGRQQIKLTIEDNFGGIKLNINQIFNLNVSAKKNSSGIGLYIAKQLVNKSFNGTIAAENIDQKGAIFTIIL